MAEKCLGDCTKVGAARSLRQVTGPKSTVTSEFEVVSRSYDGLSCFDRNRRPVIRLPRRHREASVASFLGKCLLTFLLLTLPSVTSRAESRMIYGVPFGLTSLEPVSEGIYQIEVMGEIQVAPAEKINQVVFDAYFNSPLAKVAAPLPGLPGSLLRTIVLHAAQQGDISNSLSALLKFARQTDVKSSDTASLLAELINLPGREVAHQFLAGRDVFIIQPVALAPLLMRLLTDDAEFLRSSCSELMLRVLGAMRRRLVSEGLAALLRDPSKADHLTPMIENYGSVYGISDDGALDLSLLREEVSYIWSGVRNGDLTPLSLIPLLLEQAEDILLPGDHGVIIDFILGLVAQLEKTDKSDAAVRLIVSVPFSRRTPALHQALARTLGRVSPSEQSILLDDGAREVVLGYALVDLSIREAASSAVERLTSYLLERGEVAAAQRLIQAVADTLGGWTPRLVDQTLDVVAGLSQAGFREAARQALGQIGGRVGVASYPRYLWLRVQLGASVKHLVVLLIYLLLIWIMYWYVRRLTTSRYQAIDSAFKDERGESQAPKFVQYRSHASPLFAEYYRNLELLGLRPGATPAQIKQSYRDGIKRLRTVLDRGRDLQATEELMKIQAAYRRVQEIESSPLFTGLLRDGEENSDGHPRSTSS